MASNSALSDPPLGSPGSPAPAPIAPEPGGLRVWRMAQRLTDPATRRGRAWTIADAARAYSAYIGREVHYVTWKGWELPLGAPGSRIPHQADMLGLNAFTRGAVRADHFYGIDAGTAAGGD